MTYPSFKTYIRTLGGLLKRRGTWLLHEAQDLSQFCLAYGEALGLNPDERKSLMLAAYFKNLGAIFVSDRLLKQEFQDHEQMMTSLNSRFAESLQLARDAGLDEVVLILEQYHLREIPENRLARIFQVLNTWVACQRPKGWGDAMTERDALIVLEQRAHLKWSDPEVVRHFVDYYNRYGMSLRSSR